ncbi:unnamed protein product [Musa acuminata var. zebrina]
MPIALCSIRLPILSSSQIPHRNHKPPSVSSPSPPLVLRFRTSRRQNLRYLKSLGITATSPESIAWTLAVVEFLKSKGFSDRHFPRLSSASPTIFSSADVNRTLAPVFAFLVTELSADPDQARDLILRCPDLLMASVDYRLRPTLLFLQELGLRSLSSPTNLNAHLLNTPVEKLASKIRFLEGLGLSHQEASKVCARCPAIFGYSVENNLRPKVEYLVREMGRSMEEVNEFPQYFAFSMEKKIRPRHLHLKERGVRIPLQRMLLWSDDRFYRKWK